MLLFVCDLHRKGGTNIPMDNTRLWCVHSSSTKDTEGKQISQRTLLAAVVWRCVCVKHFRRTNRRLLEVLFLAVAPEAAETGVGTELVEHLKRSTAIENP